MKRMALIISILTVVLNASLPMRPAAHESPVDHVSRKLWIWVQGEHLHLRYEEQLGERAAMLELHAMDRNRDGSIQASERKAFFLDKRTALANDLKLNFEGENLQLQPSEKVLLKPNWRQLYCFHAKIGSLEPGKRKGRLIDRHSRKYPGFYTWKAQPPEDVVAAAKEKPGAEAMAALAIKAAPKPTAKDKHEDTMVWEFEVVFSARKGK